MQLVEFEGRTVEFPDDFTDDEIADALSTLEPAAPIGGAAARGSMIEAELFDGTILEFPHGTAPEVIQRVAKERTALRRGLTRPPASAAAPVRTSEASLVDTIMGGVGAVGGVLDQGARGIAEGVSNIAGLPGTVGQGINSLLRFGAEKAGAPQSVQDMAGNVNLLARIWPTGERIQQAGDNVNDLIADIMGTTRPDQTPDNLPERFANRVGDEVGAMAVPTTAVLSKAEKLRRTLGDAAPAAVRQSGRLSRMFLEPAVVNPGRYIGNETKVAAGAGLGAAGMNEAVDPNTRQGQIADIIGAIFGAGGTAAGQKLWQSGAEMARAVFGGKGYVDDVVRDGVTDRIVEAARIPTKPGEAADTTGLVETIMSGTRVSDTIPGVRESLADRTKNSSIASLEYNRQSGPNAGEFNARRQGNARAIDEALSGVAPGGSPAALRGELDLERSRRLGDAGVMRQNAEEDAIAAIMGLQPIGTSAARGNTVRTALEDSRDVARARTEDAYREADVDGNQIDPAQLTATLDEALAPLTEVERGLVPQGVIDRVRALGRTAEDGPVDTGLLDASGAPITRAPEPPEPVSLKEATDLRSELQRLRRAAAADPRAEKGGRNAARVLNRLTASVDGFISRNMTDDQNAALETARGAKFEEAEAFTRQGDPVAAALARNEGGMPRMRDDRVAGTFTNPENMDRLFAQADTPQVRAAIRSEILAGADTSRAERIQQFVAGNTEQLNRFPGLQQELEAAATARTNEATARTTETTLQRELGTPDGRRGTSTVGKFLSYSDANSDKAISEVLAAKDPAKAAPSPTSTRLARLVRLSSMLGIARAMVLLSRLLLVF